MKPFVRTSYETICENIVSQYQILVPSVPRGDRFSAQTTENRIYNWAAVKRGSPVNRFHVAMGLFSNRSQKTSIKCDKNIDTLACNPFDTSLFLPHFDVTCNLLLNRLTATWNLLLSGGCEVCPGCDGCVSCEGRTGCCGLAGCGGCEVSGGCIGCVGCVYCGG